MSRWGRPCVWGASHRVSDPSPSVTTTIFMLLRDMIRFADAGGRQTFSFAVVLLVLHRKILGLVFWRRTHIYVVCRPHVSQEIMSGVVCGCKGCLLNRCVRFFLKRQCLSRPKIGCGKDWCLKPTRRVCSSHVM